MPVNSTAIHGIQLDNGLTILLKEIHSAPLISQWIWYRVGSRNEKPGITGISHFVEHILFKGTNQYPAHVIDHAIAREGGIMNGMTFLDWTTFYETMPSDKIDFSLRMEADRMSNCLFTAEEIETERTVILSEREGNENEPLFRLAEAVQAEAFSYHPYHYEVIGTKEDISTLSREALIQHYQRYYTPANALVVLAGNFKSAEMEKILREIYEGIPSVSHPSLPIAQEGPLETEKEVLIEGPGETTYLQIAYRAPKATEKDFFILSVLDSILSGPATLNMFGSGISNKTSRLYKALVEKDLATTVSGGLTATIDPYLFDISATIHPQKDVREVICAIDGEIDKLVNHKIKNEEIQSALKQARALFVYGSENITNQAFWMGYSNMFANYAWFESYLENLEKVTAEELISAAQNYLDASRRVVGIYQPRKA